MLRNFKLFDQPLNSIPDGRQIIATLNANSYNITREDSDFEKALLDCDILLPDGVGVTIAMRFLDGRRLDKIAGADLFRHEMERMQEIGGKVMFLGSSESTLCKITERAAREYPNVGVAFFSPPYKQEFSREDDLAMIAAVNACEPDVLFVGMTAPKQEKWVCRHKDELRAGHICSIGAVFDFYAGTVRRAPHWMIRIGMEWFYRLVVEPRRLWRRYIVGNAKFVCAVIRERFIG
jgi:N-acetylglucosaminyldiphosphoundecaprenol N-acetyl-beta-D-mannosaminyltransferase